MASAALGRTETPPEAAADSVASGDSAAAAEGRRKKFPTGSEPTDVPPVPVAAPPAMGPPEKSSGGSSRTSGDDDPRGDGLDIPQDEGTAQLQALPHADNAVDSSMRSSHAAAASSSSQRQGPPPLGCTAEEAPQDDRTRRSPDFLANQDFASVAGGSSTAPAACVPCGSAEGSEAAQQGEPLDVASLFLLPSEDLDPWASGGCDLLLPASSFVSADAISQHRGPMTLGRVALFIFGLFQGDVRMGLLSAQGRLLAWRCLLYLAEQHDRQVSGGQQHASPQQGGSNNAQAPGVSAAGDAGMRRRRLQRESVATSKGRRSVRHAFLLDRSGAARAAGAGAPAGPPPLGGYSPGANDEWAEAEEEAPSSMNVREEAPGETAGEQALVVPGLSAAMTLQRQLQKGQQTIGFERHFTRFVGGTIDRRWALQQRHLRIPSEASRGEGAASKEELLELKLEEYGVAAAPKMWPKIAALPERIFVGLPVQVATWVGWGRSDRGDTGRMLWRDCEVSQLLPGGAFRATCFFPGDPKEFTCQIRDFVAPRVPSPSPNECAWRLVPVEADPLRDIYPGACLSVGLAVASSPQQEQQPHGENAARAYFVDVVVQDVYFSLEQASRAKQAVAEAREHEDTPPLALKQALTAIGRKSLGGADSGGESGPPEGLRPNCAVRAMRVMVLRTGGAANEFALVSGRVVYKLPYDLYNGGSGVLKESPWKQRQQGGPRLVWAIPRALTPATPEQIRGRGASGGSASASLGGEDVDAVAKRWKYKTQADSRDWIAFPPFVVVYLEFDGSAQYTETHPLLQRYLQPELDLAALSHGSWRLCLPQYEHPKELPVLLPHPSDLPPAEKAGALRPEAGDAAAENAIVLESPYARSSGVGAFLAGVEGRTALSSDELADSLLVTHACEPPQPVGGAQSGSGDSAGRGTVLSINHLASLLCSGGGDSAPSKELLARAIPFFRGVLPHLGAHSSNWQLDVARSALRAAEQAKELYVEEQETEAEKLRLQGIAFTGSLVGSGGGTEGMRSHRGTEAVGTAAEADSGDSWEWAGSSGSRYPTSSDISRFLLRTSGHAMGSTAGRSLGGEPVFASGEAAGGPLGGAGRRRPLGAVASLLSQDSRRGSTSELNPSEARCRGEDSPYLARGALGAEGEHHTTRRTTGSGVLRSQPEEAAAAGLGGGSARVPRRRTLPQREEEEDFQPSVRTAAASARQSSSGGRAGAVRRATRNVSYAALAGMDQGQDDSAVPYRPVKRLARGELPATSLDASHAAADQWENAHTRDAGAADLASGESVLRGTLHQWAALQRQAAAAEERLLSIQGSRPDRAVDTSISTDQLHEALKGFVQSIKAGSSSAPVVSVPPMARDRSFAASH
ncbi:uncharacterized protein LOC34622130 [Cyclospora cayetanensis]|uniref:Uncharacterized protein LOC34622130 n=1 Tax=Cyclospora cayetanensis TaxID=88456 RepID=A0A6P6RXL2_9EIME|nr:uncharacterized protein LOC34622130 [Cyclospora cayetanensis]